MRLIKYMLMLTVPLVILAACGGKETSSGASESRSSASEPVVITDSKIGEHDGYSYELWKDKGDTQMTLTGGGCFTCEWSRINNALFRTGRKLDCTKTYKEYGEISFDYGVDYQPKGNSYLCVYGWSKAPLVEYYIVESWGNWRPPGADSSLGTVEIDGNIYDVYKTTRVDQPSIAGTKTFDQYWSVRREKPADGKIEGKVSVTRHFEEWEKLGLTLGKLYEASFTVEGYQSSGKAEVYRNELTMDG
ncbi:Glycosyl hydrolases family 11 [Ruminococcaceae bacterium FB2012]|nr:Glycosyl hydrolases family 11 [Ruminococcaceae bacterium FB2012]